MSAGQRSYTGEMRLEPITTMSAAADPYFDAGYWQWLPGFRTHIVKSTDDPLETTLPAAGFCDPMLPTRSQLVVPLSVSVPRFRPTEPRAPCAAGSASPTMLGTVTVTLLMT